jgi:hypothetical protein
MVNVKNVIMSLFLIMTLMSFCVKYSYSQEKPSEDVIKKYILTDYFINPSPDTNIRYTLFQITNSFFKKGSDGMDYYYVKVNYNIRYTIINYEGSGKSKDDTITGKVVKLIFLKKEGNWYGRRGWRTD